MPVYAQVQNGKVIAISEGQSVMVPLETYDSRLLGTNFNGVYQPFADVTDFNGFKSVVTADKTEIAADGVETVTISISIKDWKDETATDFDGTIRININGSRKDLTVTAGKASYVYKTTVIGGKTIMTQDADEYTYISHGSVTVQAYGNLEEL